MIEQTPTHLAKIGSAAQIYVTCLVSILFYDWIVCFSKEIRLYHRPFFSKGNWKRRASIQSYIIYLVIRYLALIQFSLILGMIWTTWSQKACHRLFYWDSYVSAFVVATANLFLAFRTAAIWNNQRTVNIFLGVLWSAQVAVLMWAAYYQTNNKTIPFCLAIQTSNNILGLYAAPLAYDTIMLVLAMTRVVMVKKKSFVGPNLRLLIRDGFFYFMGVWICNLIATVTELQNIDPAAKAINASLATIGTSILCSRLALNTRNLVQRVNHRGDLEEARSSSKDRSPTSSSSPTFVESIRNKNILADQVGKTESQNTSMVSGSPPSGFDNHPYPQDENSQSEILQSFSSIPLPRIENAYIVK